jgi:TolB-like protein/lipoprotein NlpI
LGVAAVVLVAAIVAFVMIGRPGDETAAPVESAEQPMIVVFPFENLGPSEQDYFAAGVADEITSRLATVQSLGVISRTSAIQYDRTGKTMAEIGRDLGVSFVLEGTVRWDPSSGSNRVRVTPRLVRVAADRQMWSESYDEQLDEIFAVQTDIAERVVNALDLTLGAGERAALQARPTDNLEAYQAYLRGRDNSARDYYSRENRLRTVSILEEVVALDPDFAQAWAALSEEHSYIYHLRYDATEARREAARQAVDRALELRPDLPEAHLARGLYFYRCYRDYEKAIVELEAAARGLPNDSQVFEAIGAIRRRQGRWDEAISNSSRAGRLNPRDATNFWDLGVTYLCVARYEEAIASCDRSIAIDPEQSVAFAIKAIAYWQTQDLESSRRTFEAIPTAGNPFAEWFFILQESLERDYQAALRRARAFPVDTFQSPTTVLPKPGIEAMVLDWLDRKDRSHPGRRPSPLCNRPGPGLPRQEGRGDQVRQARGRSVSELTRCFPRTVA